MSRRSPGLARWVHWLHFGTLLLLVTGIEVGTRLLDGTGYEAAVHLLPNTLYPWIPILAAVSVSIRKADARTARAGIAVAAVAMGLMTGLDLGRAGVTVEPEAEAAVVGESLSLHNDPFSGGGSWILTLAAWQRGDLGDLAALEPARLEAGDRYDMSSPRMRMVDALLELGLVLLVPALIGLTLGAGRWIRSRVTFRRPEDEQAAHLVVAWLLAPMIQVLTVGEWAQGVGYAALFHGGSLLGILLPFVIVLALGLGAWIAPLDRAPSDPLAAGRRPIAPVHDREDEGP